MPTLDEKWTWQCDRIIPSDASTGRCLLGDMLQQLKTLHWSERDIFAVHLATDEALVNAISHGNAEDATKHVRFSCRVSPQKIHIEIVDEGPGFDPKRLPDPTTPERIGCPGGRGVMLMRAFMNRVEFLDRGNHVVLEKERTV
jgi:serine/threonine-protein kinase RsbW